MNLHQPPPPPAPARRSVSHASTAAAPSKPPPRRRLRVRYTPATTTTASPTTTPRRALERGNVGDSTSVRVNDEPPPSVPGEGGRGGEGWPRFDPEAMLSIYREMFDQSALAVADVFSTQRNHRKNRTRSYRLTNGQLCRLRATASILARIRPVAAKPRKTDYNNCRLLPLLTSSVDQRLSDLSTGRRKHECRAKRIRRQAVVPEPEIAGRVVYGEHDRRLASKYIAMWIELSKRRTTMLYEHRG